MSTIAPNHVADQEKESVALNLENGHHTGQAIESRAHAILESHEHFHDHQHSVEFLCVDDQLLMFGCVQSCYFKQLAQEAMRPLIALAQIEIVNEIEVAS